eukprot:7025417-Lingulodinium_polyedra.AAC.1
MRSQPLPDPCVDILPVHFLRVVAGLHKVCHHPVALGHNLLVRDLPRCTVIGGDAPGDGGQIITVPARHWNLEGVAVVLL